MSDLAICLSKKLAKASTACSQDPCLPVIAVELIAPNFLNRQPHLNTKCKPPSRETFRCPPLLGLHRLKLRRQLHRLLPRLLSPPHSHCRRGGEKKKGRGGGLLFGAKQEGGREVLVWPQRKGGGGFLFGAKQEKGGGSCSGLRRRISPPPSSSPPPPRAGGGFLFKPNKNPPPAPSLSTRSPSVNRYADYYRQDL